MNSLRLGSRVIDDNSDPYIIAEIGVNHECSISKAKQLILKAKEQEQMLQNFNLIKLS